MFTLKQTIDVVIKYFLKTGINCIQYKDGRRVNIASYDEMAVRTANKRAMLVSEGDVRNAYGIHTVKISKYGQCSETCLPWQGKVYVDDVWSGGTKEEAKEKNLKLLSEAMAGGLFHPNCKHRSTTYFYDLKKSLGKLEEDGAENPPEEQEHRKNRLHIQQQKRLEEGSLDPKNIAEAKSRKEMWIKKDIQLIEQFDGPINDVLESIYYKLTDEKSIVTFDDLDYTFKNAVYTMISNSKNSQIKDEFFRQLPNIRILNKKSLGWPHFTIEGKKVGIRLNVQKKDGIEILIHEIAHHIDYNLGKKNNSILMLSNSKVFINSLRDDWDIFVKDMMKWYNCSTKYEFYKLMSREMSDSKDSSYILASDIISGLTRNNCKGNSWHETDYWNDTTLCAETFAHFFEAVLIDNKQKAVLKNIFPNTFYLFENMF